MRTLIIVTLGVLLAAVFLLVGRAIPNVGVRRAAMAFLVFWTVLMFANLALGLNHGYSFGEEFPILLINIIPGALVALIGGFLLDRAAVRHRQPEAGS